MNACSSLLLKHSFVHADQVFGGGKCCSLNIVHLFRVFELVRLTPLSTFSPAHRLDAVTIMYVLNRRSTRFICYTVN